MQVENYCQVKSGIQLPAVSPRGERREMPFLTIKYRNRGLGRQQPTRLRASTTLRTQRCKEIGAIVEVTTSPRNRLVSRPRTQAMAARRGLR